MLTFTTVYRVKENIPNSYEAEISNLNLKKKRRSTKNGF